MANQTFTVTGMTCGHCEASVREEVSELPGITDVQVDRSRNFLSVTSDADIDTAAVIAAVDEAGYKAVANKTPKEESVCLSSNFSPLISPSAG